VAERLRLRETILTNDIRLLRKRRQERIDADKELVLVEYPELRLVGSPRDADAKLEGPISIRWPSGTIDRIDARIVFPVCYPSIEPQAFEPGGRFVHDADGHFYPDARCCLWMDCETQWDEHDGNALLSYVDQVAIFFERQLIFEANGRRKWPGPARGHGRDGYLELLQERLGVEPNVLLELIPAFQDYQSFNKYIDCPCRSGKKFKWCHARAVHDLINEIGRNTVSGRFRSMNQTGKV
jgi:hypothetical protein